MIRFIHTADVHFGVENYGKIDTKTGIHTRLLDFKRSFDACIDTAIEEQVDFFLFAGDAYKTTTPTPTQQRLFVSSLMRLVEAGIPIVMVIGNHDNPLSFGKAHSLDIFQHISPEWCYIIDTPGHFTIETGHGPVQIVGIPWPTRTTLALKTEHISSHPDEISSYISDTVGHVIQQYAQELDPTLPAVLTAHITVSNGTYSGSEKQAIYGKDPVLLPSQLAISPFDYVALGHLHRHQNLNPDGTPIVYSGSIERIDFGERTEDKGFCLVSIDNKATTYSFNQVPARPFYQIDIQLSSESDHTQQMLNALHAYDLTDAVVKIRYYIPDNIRDFVDIAVIEKACAHAHYIMGIFPVHTVQPRKRRQGISVESDYQTLLYTYFQHHAATHEKAEHLTKTAIDIAREADEDT